MEKITQIVKLGSVDKYGWRSAKLFIGEKGSMRCGTYRIDGPIKKGILALQVGDAMPSSLAMSVEEFRKRYADSYYAIQKLDSILI